MLNQMMGNRSVFGGPDDDDDDEEEDDEDEEDDDEDDEDYDWNHNHSESTSNSMPELLPRRPQDAPRNHNNNNAAGAAANDHDSDDDSMPPLVVRPNHAESSEEEDDDSDGDESVPPLLARQENTANVDSGDDDDDDSDDDSLPPLVHRPHLESSSDDDDDDDDNDDDDDDDDSNDSLPNLLQRPSSTGTTNHNRPGNNDEYDSDESMPGLLPRQRLSDSNHDPDDSSDDDSDDDMPPLLPRQGGATPNANANSTAAPAPASAPGLPDPNDFASGLRRGFLSGNTNTNSSSNTSTRSQPTSSTTTSSTPAANQYRNQARRHQGRNQNNQEPETTTTTPVQDVLPPLLDRNSFGSRRVHEQRVTDQLRLAQTQNTLKLQQGKEQASRNIIGRWVCQNHLRRSCQQWYQKTCKSNIRLQAWGRQLLVKAQYHEILQTRIAQSKRFQSFWKQVMVQVVALDKNASKEQVELSWEDIKAKRCDMMQSLEDTDALAVETDEKLDSAIRTALLQDDDEDMEGDEFHDTQQVAVDPSTTTTIEDGNDYLEQAQAQPPTTISTLPLEPRPQCDHIQLTKEVLKWLDRADSKYRGFFLRRITQLANGDRSRILRKSLTGCQTAIWETYLDMKSGQRILWTECKCTTKDMTTQGEQEQQQLSDGNHNTTTRGLLIWYVAKHGTYTSCCMLGGLV
jgi:hypothetical protein